MSTEKKTAVNAAITGIIKAVGFDINAGSGSYVEAKAEPFYRQQLVNLRHFERKHCSAHGAMCSKALCTDSLKAGKMSVYTYTEWKGGVGVTGQEVTAVKIGNERRLPGRIGDEQRRHECTELMAQFSCQPF